MIGPDPQVVLLGRLELEERRVAQARTVFTTTGPGAPLLGQIAGDRVEALLTDAQRQLNQLRERLRTGRPGPDEVGTTVSLQAATDRVLSECLTLAVGALARAVGLDSGACAEADDLVRDISEEIDRRLFRPTVPATQEELHRATDVIRRRVPDHGLWDLAVTAHELGHVVTPALQSYASIDDRMRRPVEDFLRPYSGARRIQAGELFCDVFATYTVGPAYPCTLLLHRLDPGAPAVTDPDATHPGDAVRAYAVLWTLEEMQENGSHPYRRIIRQLGDAWRALQRYAGPEARLTVEQQSELRAELRACRPVLEQLRPIRYEWSDNLRDLVPTLERPSAETSPSRPYSRFDVLNAAWIVRLEAWSRQEQPPPDLEENARKLMHRLAGANGTTGTA